MYAWLGISLALALLFALNTAISLVVGAGWRLAAPSVQNWNGVRLARCLFLLRILPGLTALAGVGLLLPAYLVHEPRETTESVSFKLALLAGLSFAGLALALWRGLAVWWTTRTLVNNWMQHSTPVVLPEVTIPAFRLQHRFPVLAVVGIWRPRLFIAEQLLTGLTQAELAATLKHEMGHLFARDNFKRTALRACRDVLMLIPTGRALDLAWDEAAEEAADEYAVRENPGTALALASALVKIARLAPAGLRAALPVQASFIAALTSPKVETMLARRIHRLLQLADAAPARLTPLSLRWQVTRGLVLLGFVLGLVALAINPLWLARLHEFNEWVVFSLR